MNLGTAQIIQGNALNLPLPDASVDLICTSPPYFGLRSYQDTELCDRCKELLGQGWEYYRPDDRSRNLREAWPDWDAHVAEFHKPNHYDGQIGSEATPAEFLDALLAATREMVRVLKPSGSIFVNLGDKYAGSRMDGSSDNGTGSTGLDGGISVRDRSASRGQGVKRQTSIPTKSLMGIPWRYAIACIDQLGLILRAEIIWSKPNGLPESVTDRVRRSHEQWFHFTVQPRYFAAVDEIRQPHEMGPNSHTWGNVGAQGGTQGADRRTPDPNARGGIRTNGPREYNPLGKLPGSVWTIPTQPLTVPPELGVDHFAAYPMEWPRRIIQGWTPNGICTACEQGRRPVAEAEYSNWSDNGQKMRISREVEPGRKLSYVSGMRAERMTTITGYACACDPSCQSCGTASDTCLRMGMDVCCRYCEHHPTASTTPAVVLDPFGGTGTTALVAKALGRTGISIDLSSDYCRLATWRCNDPRELAAALQVEKPEIVHPDQLDLFSETL